MTEKKYIRIMDEHFHEKVFKFKTEAIRIFTCKENLSNFNPKSSLQMQYLKFHYQQIEKRAGSHFSKKSNKKRRKGDLKSLKNNLIKNYNKCFYCGSTYPKEFTTLDHYIPYCKTQNNSKNNIRIACSFCNNLKGDLNPKSKQWKRIVQQKYALQNASMGKYLIFKFQQKSKEYQKHNIYTMYEEFIRYQKESQGLLKPPRKLKKEFKKLSKERIAA